MDRKVVRGGVLKPSPNQLCIGIWNVERVCDAKLATLETYMHEYGIRILCLQEVRRFLSDYCITEKVLLLICSGGEHAFEYVGVGFLVHVLLRKNVKTTKIEALAQVGCVVISSS